MRRTIVGTFLTAALVAGPAAATAAAQAPVADQTAAVQVLAQENRDNDDDNGGWGLWGLAGPAGSAGSHPPPFQVARHEPPRHQPGHGGGAHPTDRI
ncbi:hypothetical protein LUX05_07080 [Streptomyces somaliensis]|nr:hypothetical protein [Streptomyces somaliensis]